MEEEGRGGMDGEWVEVAQVELRDGGNEKKTREHTASTRTHTHTNVKQTVGQENLLPVITLSVRWLSRCLLAPSARAGHIDSHTAHTPLQHEI